MLKLDASGFISALDQLARFQAKVDARSEELDADVALSDTVRPTYKAIAERLLTDLDVLQTPAAYIRLSRLIRYIDAPAFSYKMLAEAIDDVNRRIADEMTCIGVYVLDQSKTKHFEEPLELFGREIISKFVGLAFEIDEASKCFAIHRHTACVFHLMRVMEIGIQAARKCLSIPDPIKDAERNWGVILRKFKEEFDRRSKSSPPQWSGGDKAFFEEVYVSLDAVRNAWRNTTMHVESKYTGEEAEHIYVATRGFMKKLASRMDESGDPKA